MFLNNSDGGPLSFSGKIHLIQNDQELEDAFNRLGTIQAFGFDTETRPSFKKGEVYKVSLLQLATETEAYLIRLQQIKNFTIIQRIFENIEVLKIGVAIRDDIKALQKRFNFEPKNFIELQDLAKAKGLQNFGLKGMTEEVLNQTIVKSTKMTNWDAQELTEKQLKYAATDAWLGLQLYLELR